MAYNGWLTYGGIEIAHNARTCAYIRNGFGSPGMQSYDCGCDALAPAIGSDFTSPLRDQAPWVDAHNHSSRLVSGLLVSNVEGLDGPDIMRATVTNSGNGGTLGPLWLGPRLITVSGWVFGRTQAALDDYLNWLTLVLVGESPSSAVDCDLGVLEFYAGCPKPLIQPCPTDDLIERVSYDLGGSWGANPEQHGTECGTGWVVDGVTLDDTCTVEDFDILCYPDMPGLAAGTGSAAFAESCADVSRAANFGDFSGAVEPDISAAPFVAIGNGLCDYEIQGIASGQRDTFRLEHNATGEIVGDVDYSFEVTQASGNLGLGLYHAPTDSFLPVTSQSSPQGLLAPINTNGNSIRVLTYNSALGAWVVSFDADGLDLADLSVVWWAVNGSGPETIASHGLSGTIAGSNGVDHGCAAGGWTIGGTNVDPSTASPVLWNSPADLATWMRAHDPNDIDWQHDPGNAEICASIPDGLVAQYGTLNGCGGESSTPVLTVVTPDLACNWWQDPADVARWFTQYDPRGRVWTADGLVVSTIVAAGDGAPYGTVGVCGGAADVAPTITAEDGAVDETGDLAALYRQARNVGLVSGPTIEGKWTKAGHSHGYRISFDLLAETPYLYGAAIWGQAQAFTGADVAPVAVANCPSGDLVPDCFADLPDVPSFTVAGCYTDPTVARLACFPLNNTDRHRGAVALLEVNANAMAAQNLRIAVYTRELNDPLCPALTLTADEFEVFECDRKLAVLEISELPAGSTLLIDGRDLNATLTLADGSQMPGTQFVSGEEGAPLSFVDIAPSTELCVLAQIDAAQPDTVTIRSGLAPRYMAGGK